MVQEDLPQAALRMSDTNLLSFVSVCQLRLVFSTRTLMAHLTRWFHRKSPAATGKIPVSIRKSVLFFLLICLENCANYCNYSHK